MLDKSNAINSDLSYLKSKVRGHFDKIFFHLDQNLSENKQEFKGYLTDLMDAIITNQFGNKEQVLEELGRLNHGAVLVEALDETDKILNDSNRSKLFTDLKQRLVTLQGGAIAGDEAIVEFIQKYSKPYLTKLFEEKKAVLEEELKPKPSVSQEEEEQAASAPSPSPGNPGGDSPLRRKEQLREILGLSQENFERIPSDLRDTMYHNIMPKPEPSYRESTTKSSPLKPNRQNAL